VMMNLYRANGLIDEDQLLRYQRYREIARARQGVTPPAAPSDGGAP